MSAMLTVAAVGTAFSIYSGAQQGKAQKNAMNAAGAAYGNNAQIANQLRERQTSIVDPVVNAKIAELSGKKLTAGGQLATDRFNAEMGASDRQIREQADLTGGGVAGSRTLTNQFRRAQGLAGINLQDTAQKNAELGGYLDRASQTPAWAQVATGANTQQGAFQERTASTAGANEASAYSTAAQGLGTLAAMYAAKRAREDDGGATPTPTNANVPAFVNQPLPAPRNGWDPGLFTTPQYAYGR